LLHAVSCSRYNKAVAVAVAMGVLFSCPADDYDPLHLVEEEAAPPSAGGAGEEPAVFTAALGSGKLRIEGSLSFKRAQAALQVETEISIRTAAMPAPGPGPLPRGARFAGPAAADSPKHEAAALRLQKVYKSFRTRRQLADCAVLVEQSWWKLLDFALLKRSSVSFFDIEKQETAVSKWSRARTRVAKVTQFFFSFSFCASASIVERIYKVCGLGC
jgi:hypothetical protein